jgi:phospholipid transport system substrate-binding protein
MSRRAFTDAMWRHNPRELAMKSLPINSLPMVLGRRTLLILAAAGAAAVALPWARAAAQTAMPTPTQAAAFVKQTGDALVDIVNGPGSLAEKQAKLQPVIEQAVDVPDVAQFCLGRFWRIATPAQQQQYEQLFHTVLLNNITGKLGDYRGVTFQMGEAEPRADGVYVHTVVTRPNNPPANVIWVVENKDGRPKIVDVIAEGTSLRLTQRSDYASYLVRNNNSVDALISAMRRQVQG